MGRTILLAGAALVQPGFAEAQDAPATAAPVAESAQNGVLVYPPEFFASARPNSAYEMIQRLPGFSLDTGDAEARGLAGAAGNVVIDGQRPSSKTDNLFEILRRISAASVERIELIRGGAPGIDMQGRPVIANVVLKRTATTEKVLETNAYFYRDAYVGPLIKGQYSRREGDNQTEAAFSVTTDRTGGTASGSRVRTDAAGAVIQTADLDLRDRYRNASIRGALQRPVAGGKLRVNALLDYTNFNNRQIVTILSGAGTSNRNQDVDHEWSGELGANWTRALGPRTELNLVALQRGSRERYDSSSADASGATSEFDTAALAGESVLRATLKYRQSDRWAFETGGEIAYNFLDTSGDYRENGAAVALPNAQVLVSELRGEAFGQTTFRPSSSFTVEGTLRAEYSRISQSGDTDKSKSFFYPKPRLQLTWVPGKGHQVRLRIEKSVGQLDFGDFAASTEINLGTVAAGNADLRPRQTLAFAATYERRFWGKGVFEFSLGHAEISDVVDIIPLVGGFDAVGNIGHGTRDSVSVSTTLPLDRFGLSNALLMARATAQHSHVVDPVTGQSRQLSNEIPFGCGVSFSQDLKGGRFSYGFEHGCNQDISSSYRVREARIANTDPFVTIYGQWKPNPALSVRVDLGNLTNARFYNSREVHSGPRNLTPIVFNEERIRRQGQYLFIQLRHVL